MSRSIATISTLAAGVATGCARRWRHDRWPFRSRRRKLLISSPYFLPNQRKNLISHLDNRGNQSICRKSGTHQLPWSLEVWSGPLDRLKRVRSARGEPAVLHGESSLPWQGVRAGPSLGDYLPFFSLFPSKNPWLILKKFGCEPFIDSVGLSCK